MKIEREIKGDLALLTLRGEFDSFVVSAFLEEIESLVVNGIKNIVLDMRGVKFIMSTAIGAIVKSRKRVKEAGGDLAISQPSPFVRDVLESLGLFKVIKVFEQNEQAIEVFGESFTTELPTGNAVMVRFSEPERQKTIGRPIVARIVDINADGISFQAPQAASFFPSTTPVKTKFRLPLFKKAYYFEVSARVASAAANEQGALVAVRFEEITEEDRKSIRQFVADMQFLRDEVKHAGEN